MENPKPEPHGEAITNKDNQHQTTTQDTKLLSPETGIETMIHTIMSATITSNRVSRSIPFGNKDANMGSMHWFLVGVFL